MQDTLPLRMRAHVRIQRVNERRILEPGPESLDETAPPIARRSEPVGDVLVRHVTDHPRFRLAAQVGRHPDGQRIAECRRQRIDEGGVQAHAGRRDRARAAAADKFVRQARDSADMVSRTLQPERHRPGLVKHLVDLVPDVHHVGTRAARGAETWTYGLKFHSLGGGQRIHLDPPAEDGERRCVWARHPIGPRRGADRGDRTHNRSAAEFHDEETARLRFDQVPRAEGRTARGAQHHGAAD